MPRGAIRQIFICDQPGCDATVDATLLPAEIVNGGDEIIEMFRKMGLMAPLMAQSILEAGWRVEGTDQEPRVLCDLHVQQKAPTDG